METGDTITAQLLNHAEDDVPAWSDGAVYAYNSNAEQSSAVNADMTFYSTVEFPQES